jgi:hypothetical protein
VPGTHRIFGFDPPDRGVPKNVRGELEKILRRGPIPRKRWHSLILYDISLYHTWLNGSEGGNGRHTLHTCAAPANDWNSGTATIAASLSSLTLTASLSLERVLRMRGYSDADKLGADRLGADCMFLLYTVPPMFMLCGVSNVSAVYRHSNISGI